MHERALPLRYIRSGARRGLESAGSVDPAASGRLQMVRDEEAKRSRRRGRTMTPPKPARFGESAKSASSVDVRDPQTYAINPQITQMTQIKKQKGTEEEDAR